MKISKLYILVYIIILLIITSVPKILNYQGKLLNSDGVGIEGDFAMIFSIYSSETGGIPLWSENKNVIINKGLFSVNLGDLNEFPDTLTFDRQYWLEISIDGETMSERELLTSTPYSMRAGKVDTALQYFSTSSNPEPRTGRLVFSAGDGVTLSDDGDSVVIIFDSGGSSISETSAGNGLSFDGDSLNVNVDNSTIEINDDFLQVKTGGITGQHIATDSATAAHIYNLLPWIPTITSIDPDSVFQGYSSFTINIQGTNFKSYAQAKIGDVELTDENVISSTSMTATVPEGLISGNYDITVKNWWQTATEDNYFEVIPLFPMSGLVSYYKLDETSGTTAYDSHGSYNGTIGTVTLGETGKIGTAHTFPGGIGSSHTRILTDHGINENEDYTITLWAKIDAFETNAHIWNKYNNNNKVAFQLCLRTEDSSATLVRVRYNNGKDTIAVTNPLEIGTWYNFTVTVDGPDNGALFLNGLLVGSGNASGNGLYNYSTGISLGNYLTYPSNGANLNGMIDEFGIWNRILTNEEIQQLYNSGYGVTYPD